MLLQPGLTAEGCPNRETCGILTELTPEEEVELIRVRQGERERVRVSQRQAAAMMLLSRGCPQSPDSLGVSEVLAQVEARLDQLREQLAQFNEVYIAPPDSETHRYNVKRPRGTYTYNKLTAQSPIFEPSEKQQKVTVIHLSHDDDARNLEGREGIERRNKLLHLRTALTQIEQKLAEVLAE